MNTIIAREVSESAAPRKRAPIHPTLSVSPPLELAIGERTIHFLAPEDFEFALHGRTHVPAYEIALLTERPPHLLAREAHGIQQVEDRLADTLRRSMLDPSAIEELLGGMWPVQFSRDHDWRVIMESIKDMPMRFGAYKRIALTKYVEYLAARREALQAFIRGRLQDAGREIPCPGDGDELKQTLLFELEDPDSGARKSGRYQRIPKGETLEFRIHPGESLGLKLAAREFRLTAADRFQLVDQAGGSWRLDNAVSLIGRGPTCDVVVNPDYEDVSRRHLMIETVGSEAVQLTDLSSHGTYLLEDHLSLARPVLTYRP